MGGNSSKECMKVKSKLFEIFKFKFGNGKGPTLLFIGGVHGDEKSGTIYLNKLVDILQNAKQNNVNFNGSIIVIPLANKWGFDNNERKNKENKDVNREFPKHEEGKCSDEISKQLLKIVRNADYVFDFHEGYDFHKINPSSIGSTLTNANDKTYYLSQFILENLNKMIQDSYKKFTLLEDKERIIGSLRNYCKMIDKNYILIEITGQNNKQPMDIRLDQIQNIVQSIFNYFDLKIDV
jgi:predicted deacylase